MSSTEDPVFPHERNLYGHRFDRTIMGMQLEKMF